MGLTVKLTRRRSETFPPPYLFLFFIDFSGIFFLVFIFIFEYISGRFLLTSGTRWHYPRAGWKSDPTALVWSDSDFKNNPSDSHSSPSSSVSPISARTRLVLFFYYFFFPFFCLSYILCFCCKWISVFFLFFSVWKMNGFVESADDKQAASVTWTPSLLFSNRRGRWPLNVETRCWGRRCGLHFQDEFFWAYEVKKKKRKTIFDQKKEGKRKKRTFTVRYCALSVSPQIKYCCCKFSNSAELRYLQYLDPKYYLFASQRTYSTLQHQLAR